jgi:hypothetical protein
MNMYIGKGMSVNVFNLQSSKMDFVKFYIGSLQWKLSKFNFGSYWSDITLLHMKLKTNFMNSVKLTHYLKQIVDVYIPLYSTIFWYSKYLMKYNKHFWLQYDTCTVGCELNVVVKWLAFLLHFWEVWVQICPDCLFWLVLFLLFLGPSRQMAS